MWMWNIIVLNGGEVSIKIFIVDCQGNFEI